MQRRPRLVDPRYLKWLRTLPCSVCQKSAPSDAAHIRYGSVAFEKRSIGMGEKPDDKWAIPLCRECHTVQHSMNERIYWASVLIHPLALATGLYAQYGGTGGRPFKKSRMRKNEMKRKINGEIVMR